MTAPLDGLISFDALAQDHWERMAENGVVPAGNGVGSHDPVNHPRHYTAGAVECIDAIEAALGPEGFVAYCRGNALKYCWRGPLKNGLEDLAKAVWYLQRAIQSSRQTAATRSAQTFTRPLGAPCD